MKRFIASFSKLTASQFAEECKEVSPANSITKTDVAPPADVKAKQAVPVMLAYVKDEPGKSVSLAKEERVSLSAMVEALDRRFGNGFTERVMRELNAMPNGSFSLHHKP